MGTLTTKSMHVSEFPNVRSKNSEEISLEAFFHKIKSGVCKASVMQLRQLRATPGKEAEAHAVKESLPCITPIGVCLNGHAVKNLAALSEALCIDLDHTDERTAEVKEKIKSLPWVYGCCISPSGEGVKVMVHVRAEDVMADYPRLYAAVGKAVSQCTGHPYDEKCGILTQPCFYSYDSEAFFRPDAVSFTLDEPTEIRNTPVAVTCIAGAENGKAGGKEELSGVVSLAPGFIVHFLDRFERENPFVRGKRNDIAMKLGRVAAYSGFTPEELKELSKNFIRHYANADFTAVDIRKRIESGYQHVIDKGEAENGGTWAHFGLRLTGGPKSCARVNNLLGDEDSASEEEGTGNEDESTEGVMAHNNILRASTPYIPEEVYNHLHGFLKRCVGFATNPRERDLLLLGTLNCCSALFPYVRFLYHKAVCSPHFYLAVVAPAGTGKGVLSYTASLLDATQDYYDSLRTKLKKEYEEQQLQWEEELVKSRREKRKADLKLKPLPPSYPYFKIPATISKSRFIESLAAAGEIGCCMTTTEMVTLSTAINQDYGRFEDILLKAYHNEEVASSYKTDGDPIVVRNPHLSVCMSGTQEQFCGFFRSLEVGLFSRFAIYTRQQDLRWESCAPEEGATDVRSEFRTLGKELFAMHEGLLQSPTRITFTKEQWKEHTEYYSGAICQNSLEGREAIGGIIYRNGLLAIRLAATLTMFRKWDDYRYAKDYACTDEDFHAALLIARTLLEHSLLLSTSLPESQYKPVAMSNPHRMESVMDVLSEHFTYTEFLHAAIDSGIPKSSARRMLSRAVDAELVEKEENGYKKKEIAHYLGS